MNKFFLTAGLIFALLPFDCAAQFDLGDYRQNLEISANNIIFSGSYDGKSFFDAGNEAILVPKMKPGIGAGIEYGFGIGSNGGVDFAYRFSVSDYTTMYNDISGKATVHVVKLLGFKIYFDRFAQSRVKPYWYIIDWTLTFGHFNRIAYTDGIVDEKEVKGRSANFNGMAFGSGLGLQCMLAKNLAIDLRVLPELQFVTDLKTKGMERHDVSKFKNLMLINTLGIRYYFKER